MHVEAIEPISHNHETYKPGERFEVTGKEGLALILAKAAVEVPAEESPEGAKGAEGSESLEGNEEGKTEGETEEDKAPKEPKAPKKPKGMTEGQA